MCYSWNCASIDTLVETIGQKFEFVQIKKSRIKIFINFNRVQITLKLFSIDHTWVDLLKNSFFLKFKIIWIEIKWLINDFNGSYLSCISNLLRLWSISLNFFQNLWIWKITKTEMSLLTCNEIAFSFPYSFFFPIHKFLQKAW